MHPQINVAKKLLKLHLSNKSPHEGVSLELGEMLLDELARKDYLQSKMEDEIQIIVAGALFMALSKPFPTKAHYEHYQYVVGETATCIKRWQQAKELGIAADHRFSGPDLENPFLIDVLLGFGAKAMNGELGSINILCRTSNVYRAGEKLLNNMVVKCGTQIYSSQLLGALKQSLLLEKNFDQAIADSKKHFRDAAQVHPASYSFIEALEKLKQFTLQHIDTEERFQSNKCLALVDGVMKFATAVSSGKLNGYHIAEFNAETKALRTHKVFAVLLSALIGAAIAAAAVVATVGLTVSGLAVGVVAGSLSGAACALWYKRKQDPQIQLAESANEILKASPKPRV